MASDSSKSSSLRSSKKADPWFRVVLAVWGVVTVALIGLLGFIFVRALTVVDDDPKTHGPSTQHVLEEQKPTESVVDHHASRTSVRYWPDGASYIPAPADSAVVPQVEIIDLPLIRGVQLSGAASGVIRKGISG